MIEAGVAKAEALGCKVSLAVVDQSCRLIGFLMMDGARHFSIITTQRKAITAASQRLPTGYAPEENAPSMSVRMGDFTNVPGGFPIEIDGEVIGAIDRLFGAVDDAGFLALLPELRLGFAELSPSECDRSRRLAGLLHRSRQPREIAPGSTGRAVRARGACASPRRHSR